MLYSVTPVSAVEIVASGNCGNGVRWSLDNLGNFYVEGNGRMINYNGYSSSEWEPYKDKIKKIIISEGITEIGQSVFYGCSNLTTVKIADSVEEIGNYAFADCTKLKNIEFGKNSKLKILGGFVECTALESFIIPDSVEQIAGEAFGGCTALKSIYAGENSKLKRINEFFPFWDCTALEEVTLPDSMNGLRANLFSDSISLKAVNIVETGNDDNSRYRSVDGVVYAENWGELTSLVLYPAGKTDKSYTIPQTVSEIANWAFSGCGYVEKISAEKGIYLKNIESDAFRGCTSLKEVDLTNISDNSLYCSVDGVVYDKDMKRLCYYPEGKPDEVFTVPASVEIFGYQEEFTGAGNTKLEWYSLLLGKVKHLKFAKNSCMMEFPATFIISDCLTSIDIPESVKTVHDAAFVNCVALESITVHNNNANYCSEDGILFSKDKTVFHTYPMGKKGEVYRIPGFVQIINSAAFNYTWQGDKCQIERLYIPLAVKEIKCALASIETVDYEGTKLQWQTINNGYYYHGDNTRINCLFSQPQYISDIWTGSYFSVYSQTNESIKLNYLHEDFVPFCEQMVNAMPKGVSWIIDLWDDLHSITSLSTVLDAKSDGSDIYLAIIFEILRTLTSSSEIHDVLNSQVKNEAETIKDKIIAFIGNKYSEENIEELINMTVGQIDDESLLDEIIGKIFEIIEEIFEIEDIAIDDGLNLDGIFEDLSHGTKLLDFVKNASTRISYYCTILEVRDSIKNVLREMVRNCDVTIYGKGFYEALKVIDNALNDEENVTEKGLIKYIMNEWSESYFDVKLDCIFEAIATKVPLISAVPTGISLGILLSNLFYNADDAFNAIKVIKASTEICNLLDTVCDLEAQKYIENGWDEDTAATYIDAERMYMVALQADCVYANQCIKEFEEAGKIDLVKVYADKAEKLYEKTKNNISDFRDYIELSWVLDYSYLRKDYPEVFKAYSDILQRELVDTTPSLIDVSFNASGAIEISFDCSKIIYDNNFVVDGYEIYAKKNNGKYELFETINDRYAKEYIWTPMPYTNDEYTFKVRSFVEAEDGNKSYSKFSNEEKIIINPIPAPELRCPFDNSGRTTLLIENNTQMTNYRISTEIYRRKIGVEEDFKLVDIVPQSTTGWYDSKAEKGADYAYMAVSVCQKDTTLLKGPNSEIFYTGKKDNIAFNSLDVNFCDNKNTIVNKVIFFSEENMTLFKAQQNDESKKASLHLTWDNSHNCDEIVIMKKCPYATDYVEVARLDGGAKEYYDSNINFDSTYEYSIAFYEEVKGVMVLRGVSSSKEIDTPKKSRVVWKAGNKYAVEYVTYGEAITSPEIDFGKNATITGWNEVIPSRAVAEEYVFTAKLNCSHEWDKGAITKFATVKAEGNKCYTCVICGETKNEKIPKKEEITYFIGDVNSDKKISAADARLVLRASVGLKKFSAEQIVLADIDNDGTVKASDARLILRASVGLEDYRKWQRKSA